MPAREFIVDAKERSAGFPFGSYKVELVVMVDDKHTVSGEKKDRTTFHLKIVEVRHPSAIGKVGTICPQAFYPAQEQGATNVTAAMAAFANMTFKEFQEIDGTKYNNYNASLLDEKACADKKRTAFLDVVPQSKNQNYRNFVWHAPKDEQPPYVYTATTTATANNGADRSGTAGGPPSSTSTASSI